MLGVRRVCDLGAVNESLTSLDRAVPKDVRVSDGIQENVRVPKQTFAYLQSKCGLAPAGGGLAHRLRLCGLVAEQCGAAVVLVEAVEDWCGVGEGLLVGAHHG